MGRGLGKFARTPFNTLNFPGLYQLPHLKLEPSRSFLRPGDSITVACTSSAGPHAEIIWEGLGGSPLPYNFRVSEIKEKFEK